MNIWTTPPGKELQLAEVLAEGNGNMEWVVENIVINTSYDYVSSYRYEDYNCHE